MILLVLACTGQGSEGAEETPPGQLPPRTHQRLKSLHLPDSLPFDARTRTQPLTVVDEHGEPLLVIEALGVRIRIERLLADRAFGTCTGCRAEVTGWFQRRALLVGSTADLATLNREEALVAWIDGQALAVLDHGVVGTGSSWLAPPWHAEGGYEGPVAEITWLAIGEFQLRVTSPAVTNE
jgi:hypothetical protein